MKSRVLPIRDGDDDSEPCSYSFECPGCGRAHELTVTKLDAKGRHWFFNGSRQYPTFNPMFLDVIESPGHPKDICHFEICEGRIKFYAGSSHALAGKTVSLTEFDL